MNGGHRSTVAIERKEVSIGLSTKLWYAVMDTLQLLKAVIISMSS
jgi:hypothetical protein